MQRGSEMVPEMVPGISAPGLKHGFRNGAGINTKRLPNEVGNDATNESTEVQK